LTYRSEVAIMRGSRRSEKPKREIMANGNWRELKLHRKRKRVSLDELADEVGASHSYIWRRELHPKHKQHVAIDDVELYELKAAIERVVRDRASADAAEVLAGD